MAFLPGAVGAAAQVARFLPTERGIIAEIVDQTVQASGAAALAAIGLLLFSGSRVFASLIAAINLMWHEIEQPGFWRRQLQRTGMVFTVGALLVLAGVADVGVALAGDVLDLPPSLRVLIQSQVVPALFIGSALFLLFYLIPRRAATWRTALSGAILGAVALRLAQALFTGYLRGFGGFDSAYGPIAGLAAVLTWALVASGIILLAAHFVAVLNSPDREPQPDEHQLPGEAEARRRPSPSGATTDRPAILAAGRGGVCGGSARSATIGAARSHLLGSGQAVRRLTLDQEIDGSNPRARAGGGPPAGCGSIVTPTTT